MLVLALELGVIAAVGVGLSGVLTRPLFSVVVTYLVVAALSIGTLIAFGLGGASIQSTVNQTTIAVDYQALDEDGLPPNGGDVPCLVRPSTEYQTPRFDAGLGLPRREPVRRRRRRLADHVRSVRAASRPVRLDRRRRAPGAARARPRARLRRMRLVQARRLVGATRLSRPPQEIYDGSVPSWFVGLAVHVLLGAGALAWAWRRSEVPARRLAAGSRIA